MITLEKWMILAPLRKLANNVDNLDKIIVAKGFEWLPKVQKITQSGHTGANKKPLMLCKLGIFYCSQINAVNLYINL